MSDKDLDEYKSFIPFVNNMQANLVANKPVTKGHAEVERPIAKPLEQTKVIDDVYDPRILSDPCHILNSLQTQLNYWKISSLQ
jgi:hypothetical protein